MYFILLQKKLRSGQFAEESSIILLNENSTLLGFLFLHFFITNLAIVERGF